MKKIITTIIITIICITLNANDLASVKSPTAAVLSRGEARVYQKIYRDNGIKFGFDVGLFDNFQAGFSYGADDFFGSNDIEWHSKPDFQVRLRLIDEEKTFPAVAIGVDTHGHGTYSKAYDRYDIKSKGLYAVASKNYQFLGLLGFDFGMNYSFETKDEDKDIDFFVAAYKTIGQQITVFAEFTAGFNDYDSETKKEDPKYYIMGRGRGYLSTAVLWRLNNNISLKFQMFDMLENRHDTNFGDRALMLDYRWFF